MRQDTVIMDRPTTNDADLLRWLTSVEGVADDRLHDGLVVDDSGRVAPLSLDYTETAWTAHPRSGRIISLDVGAESIYGRPILELRRHPALLFEAILPEDRGILRELVAIRNHGGEFSRKFRIRTGDGRVKWLMAHATLVHNAEGRAVRIEGLVRDISAETAREADSERRWRRSQLLREALERIFHDELMNHGDLEAALGRLGGLASEALEASRVSVWLADSESGDLSCRMLMTQDGARPCDVLFSRDRHGEYFDHLESNKLIAVADVDAASHDSDLRHDYLDRFAILSRLDAAVIKSGKFVGMVKVEETHDARAWLPEERRFAGRIAGHVAHVLERLEREDAERQLHLFKAGIKEAVVGVVFLDEAGRIVEVNQAFCDLNGYGADELIGNTPEMFLSEEGYARASEILATMVAGQAYSEEAFTHRRKDGSLYQGQVTAVRISDLKSGEPRIACFLEDVTEHQQYLEELQEQRRRLQTLMASLPGMAFRIRNAENWPVEFISEGCVDLIGWRPDEIIDNRVTSHAQCVHPDDIDAVWKHMDSALKARRPYEIEYRIIDKQGKVKWVWEQGLGVHDGGELVAVEGFVCDISDRVNAMQALSDSENHSRELIDNMPVGVAVVEGKGDPVEFVFKEFNKAAESIENIERECVLGASMTDVFPLLDGSFLMESLASVLETGRPVEETGILPDRAGGGRWYEFYIYRLHTGDLVLVFEDISERKRTEQNLKLKQISIDQANDAMIWTDVEGNLIDANERACELYGFDFDGLLDKSIFDITRDHTEESWRKRWDLLSQEKALRHEAIHLHNDGTEIPVEVSTRSLVADEREIHCTIVRDLSEQKRYDAEIRRMNDDLELRVQERTQDLQESQDQLLESEKMAALGRLVASVTHEINTPIGIGVTAASHLRDKLETTRTSYQSGSMKRSDFEHFLTDSDDISRMILTNLDKAARLIKGFKGVAVDQSDDAKRSFDLASYIDEIMLSLRPRFKRTRITIDVDCPVGIVVDSYPGALSQIITNLMMNSLNHGLVDSGAGRISIQAKQEDGNVLLRFQDDGVGMSDDVRRKIFEPFFTTKRGQGGSGLGMHVVYTAVTESLGGTISCESAPDEGATFLIEFPLTRGGDHE